MFHLQARHGSNALRYAGGALAVLILINVIGDWVRPGLDASRLWISATFLPHWLMRVFLLVAGCALLANAWSPVRLQWARRVTASVLAILAVAAAVNTLGFYRVLASGAIRTPMVIPLSMFVALVLAALCGQSLLQPGTAPHRAWQRIMGILPVSGAVALVLPLLLMFTFGLTDYARRADCAVVFGAKVWDDGTPSLALADRVDEGIRLYRRGLVGAVIMSGGIDPANGHSEAQVMRDRALAAGIPKAAIVLDEQGVNSVATVGNTERILSNRGWTTVLAVSHYYHLPRIHMLFSRTAVTAYTVPAPMTRRLTREPYYLVREIAAFYNSFLFQSPARAVRPRPDRALRNRVSKEPIQMRKRRACFYFCGVLYNRRPNIRL